MNPEVLEVLERYEQLARETDAAFAKVREQFPDCVACHAGCTDCCHALFDLSFIEAFYLNWKFNSIYEGAPRSRILERADKADRQGVVLKRRFNREHQKGMSANEVLEEASKARLRCPLLNKEKTCDLYEHRPLTCRIYGVPLAIEGAAHTCGLSRFERGAAYPTVRMDAIQDRLMVLSQDLVKALNSRYSELPRVFIPVSMALMNRYNDEYLGIRKPTEQGDQG